MISRAKKNSFIWIMFIVYSAIQIATIARNPAGTDALGYVLAGASVLVVIMHYLPDKG